ncbi:uncharacterized protein STEHIDRAFT_122749 [Stereum hirsutum FP-91666 SS1]|uniref:uncharacterized protein n=1 Tax=Stereum hirsutum (strain FP-91666) TaxID=721885 RepID=UPI0004449C60|nr:uncharacterized protein STEHIDRAFT_122749 [Stereum hirsutum FP-91666 SS1]EIM84786.1 hypothetical protein STEHIDRAFT_122749 [Stereum hirsutum FP-91666 SS1]
MSSSSTLNQSSTKEWLMKFFSAIDSLDINRWVDNFYTKDAVLEFGNNPAIQGAENIRKWFGDQLPLVASMKHDTGEFHEANGSIYVAATITYVVKGDPINKPIPLRAFAICHRIAVDEPTSENEGKRANKVQIFIDRGLVMERVKEIMVKA